MSFGIRNYISLSICLMLVVNLTTIFANKVMIMTKIECKNDPDVIVMTKCDITKSNEFPNGAANFEFDVKNSLDPIYVHIDSFKLKNGEYKPFFFKFDMEICSMLEKGKSGDMFAQMLSKVTKNMDTNAFHKCPLTGHIYGRNMTINLKDFSTFDSLIQTGSYRLVSTYFNNEAKKNSYATVDSYIQIKDK